jgi:hypothetical protein
MNNIVLDTIRNLSRDKILDLGVEKVDELFQYHRKVTGTGGQDFVDILNSKGIRIYYNEMAVRNEIWYMEKDDYYLQNIN